MPVVLKELPLVITYKLMLVVNSCNPQNGLLKNINKCYIYCYIYIYIERERERERECYNDKAEMCGQD